MDVCDVRVVKGQFDVSRIFIWLQWKDGKGEVGLLPRILEAGTFVAVVFFFQGNSYDVSLEANRGFIVAGM